MFTVLFLILELSVEIVNLWIVLRCSLHHMDFIMAGGLLNVAQPYLSPVRDASILIDPSHSIQISSSKFPLSVISTCQHKPYLDCPGIFNHPVNFQ